MVPLNPKEALERFGVKNASLASILPTVALPALGAFVGPRFMPHNEDLGRLLGGITGGVTGQGIKELVERHEQQASNIPMGAPYAMDPTIQDIPPWALQGANYLRPSLKMSMLLRTLAGKGV